MSITYEFIGHATHLFELGEHRVLVDPFFTSNPTTDISADEVEVDFILQTHGHFDHIEDTVAIAVRTGATVIANFEIAQWLQGQGIPEEQIHAQHLGGAFDHPFGRVKMTIAHHGSGLPDGSCGGQPGGFLITAEGKKMYIAGDTALFLDMQLYGEEGVDLFVVPIGDNFTMGPDDAVRAVQYVEPGLVVPCHYNTWPPIEQDARAWAQLVLDEAETEARVMQPGDRLVL